MTILFLPNVIILFVLSIICAVVTHLSWLRRRTKGAIWLGLAMASTAFWSFAAMVEAGIVGQENKILWSQIEYIGSTNAIPFLFVFMLVFTNREAWITRERLVGLWLPPVITLILGWTNQWHGLVWTGFSYDPANANVLVYHHGQWFSLFIAYSYGLFIALIALLVKDFIRAQRPYRTQVGIMILAAVAAAFSGVLYLTPLNPIPGFDWTPIGMASAGVVFLWGIFRLRLLDLLPIARAALIEQSVDGIVLLDPAQRVIDLNPAARRILRISTKDWIGRPANQIFAPRIDLSKIDFTQSVCRVECSYVDYARQYLELQSSHLHSRAGYLSGWLILLHDITDRKEAEMALQQANQQLKLQIAENRGLQEKLREQAIHDELTGLYNRRFLDEVLDREMEKSQCEHYPVSIAMIDLDNFKGLNDTYGHKAGDLVLQCLSDLLRKQTRKEDIISRYGGEEFVLVLPGMTRAIASSRAEDWRRGFAEKLVDYQGQQICSTISVGVAVYPADGNTLEEVVRKADMALYSAKSAGRNQVAVNGGMSGAQIHLEPGESKAD